MPDDDFDPGPLPPHDAAAERIVLGAVLVAGGRTLNDLGDLRAADFYWPQHGALYTLLQRMAADRDPVDPVAVFDRLRKDPIRGLDGTYLHTLQASVPTAASAGYYAGLVRSRAMARAIIQAGQRVTQIGYSAADAEEMTDAADQARRTIDAALDRAGDLDDEPFGAILSRTIDALEQPPRYVATPWLDLDRLIGGWAAGRLYAVGARPGVGKTVVALQAAAYAAQNDVPAVVFTLEMSATELHQRLLSQVAQVPYQRVEGHVLTDDDMNKIVQAQARMYEWPLRIIDNTGLSPATMRQALRHLSRRRPVGFVALDYLQLMASPTGSKAPRQEVVADFSRGLKLLAKEFDCPVVTASQLNRNPEQRADKVPGLSDLRESGAIEQDCDVVLLLHRDQHAEQEYDREKLLMSVAKNRHGSVGAVSLHFQGWFQRAVPMQRRLTPAAAAYPEAS